MQWIENTFGGRYPGWFGLLAVLTMLDLIILLGCAAMEAWIVFVLGQDGSNLNHPILFRMALFALMATIFIQESAQKYDRRPWLSE